MANSNLPEKLPQTGVILAYAFLAYLLGDRSFPVSQTRA